MSEWNGENVGREIRCLESWDRYCDGNEDLWDLSDSLCEQLQRYPSKGKNEKSLVKEGRRARRGRRVRERPHETRKPTHPRVPSP
jgi:hypothetical protein